MNTPRAGLRRHGFFLAALYLVLTLPARAGMTSYTLSDVARLRLEEFSFFAFVFLLCAFGIKGLWNTFARDFPSVPRLDLKRAFTLTALLSVLMLLVLSMISGARELLTPGAWKRQGTAYKLSTPASGAERRPHLEALRVALFEYAKAHEGNFPPHDFAPEIPETAWQTPDRYRSHFIYFGRRSTSQPKAIVAMEPLSFGDPRFVLFSDGEIQSLSHEKIHALLEKP
jgi:hypothetical protein